MPAQNGTRYIITNYYVFMKISPQQFMQNYIKFNDLKHRESDPYQSNGRLILKE